VAGRVIWLAIAFEGGLLLLALVLGSLLGYEPFRGIHLAWEAVLWGGVATVPPLLGMWWCARSDWEPFLRLMREVEEKIVPIFANCSVVALAFISLLAGLGEEALFRGVIQAALSDWSYPWISVVVASLLFGLGHMITPTYAILAGLLGAYLGAILVIYGNLLTVIVVHALYDFVALIYLTQKAKGFGA